MVSDDAVETGYGLLVAFAEGDQGNDFVRGFHVGVLWEQMAREADEINVTVATASLGTLQRCATHCGWVMTHEPTDYDEWALVTLKHGRRLPDLKVVK